MNRINCPTAFTRWTTTLGVWPAGMLTLFVLNKKKGTGPNNSVGLRVAPILGAFYTWQCAS